MDGILDASSRAPVTREEWLLRAVEKFRPWFKAQGSPLPKVVRVSVGFPVGSRKAIGQCHSDKAAEDKSNAVFISPVLTDPVKVLGVLLHECAHAALPFEAGHKAPFQKLAGSLGLVAPWTATGENDELKTKLRAIARELGKFPHARLDLLSRKKQGTRMLQYGCVPCKIKLRGAKATLERIDQAGGCDCPECGDRFSWLDEEDGEE